jgi:hypothetical protein
VGGVIGWLTSVYLGIAVGGRRRFLAMWAIGGLVGSYLGQRVATVIDRGLLTPDPFGRKLSGTGSR